MTWHDLAVKKCVWKSLMCPSNFYSGISRSFVAVALARVNGPSILRISTNTGTKLHQPTKQAEYVTVPCMEIGHRSLFVANAWVLGKSTSNPKVNLDFNGEFRFLSLWKSIGSNMVFRCH